ncbi:MAG: hypothetical protein KAJ76_04670 [Candidatus Heimdallarchaeota archaeon]|nr:hypothetical protein [Candidatus Heimdallarchaeota archaeon]
MSKNSIRVEVPEDEIPLIIGRKGKTITEIEKKIGMRIDVKPLLYDDEPTDSADKAQLQDHLPVDIRFTKTHVVLSFQEDLRGINVEISTNEKALFQGSIGKKGEIKIERATSIAREIIRMINKGETVYAKQK